MELRGTANRVPGARATVGDAALRSGPLPSSSAIGDAGVLAALLAVTTDAVVELGPDGTVLTWNDAAETLYGVPASRAIGAPLAQSVLTEPAVAWDLARAIAGHRVGPIDVVRRRSDATTVPVSLTLEPVRDPLGRVVGVLELGRDRRDAQVIEQLRLDLGRRQKDFEQFAYIASHDLQEPLRMVASYCHLLEVKYKGKIDKDADEFIHYAVDGAVRMRRLLNDMLRFSRVNTNGQPPIPTDAGVALARAADDVAPALKEAGGRITHGTLPSVNADPEQLVQLFQILLANAIKFRGAAAPAIAVEARREGGEWVFTVRDNGIGIDPRFQDRVFVLFQRLHGKDYEGTGIGLAVARRIVERHGGRIWFESTLGRSTSFHFTLSDAGGAA